MRAFLNRLAVTAATLSVLGIALVLPLYYYHS